MSDTISLSFLAKSGSAAKAIAKLVKGPMAIRLTSPAIQYKNIHFQIIL